MTLDEATELLNRSGVRILNCGGQFCLAMWPEVDTDELRRAIALLELDHLPVKYLDEPGLEDLHKKKPGNPHRSVKKAPVKMAAEQREDLQRERSLEVAL